MQDINLILSDLSWVPEDLAKSLSRIIPFIRNSLDVAWIGLYGSWQRGDPELTSDVDIVVFLNHEVDWFNNANGIVSHSNAQSDQFHWYIIGQKVNNYRLDSRIYSVAVVTQGMLEYYMLQGPIHLQNWVYAIKNSYLLWGNRA